MSKGTYGSCIYISEETLRKYFRYCLENDDGRLLAGKQYEILVAIFLNKYVSKKLGTPCVAGFLVKEKYCHLYKADDPWPVEKVKTFMEKHINEDSFFDLAISPVITFRPHSNTSDVLLFQMKRFGRFGHNCAKALVSYLLELKLKYSKNPSNLIIFMEGGKMPNLIEIHEQIKDNQFPFSSIMFFHIGRDRANNWKGWFGEIWPRGGGDSFDPKEFIESGNINE